MIPFPKIAPLLSAAALATVALISPLSANAQDQPTNAQDQPANAQDQPSYARPARGNDQSISGRIRSIDGAYHLTVLDQNGSVDSVQLHQGTIINPTGLSLATGMSVTITGYGAGSSFNANEIDTPYTYDGPTVYYDPYPAFGYGFGFGFDDDFRFHDGDRFRGREGGFRGHEGGFRGHEGGFRGHDGGFHGGGMRGGGFHGGGGMHGGGGHH
jgi:hypothetical protein